MPFVSLASIKALQCCNKYDLMHIHKKHKILWNVINGTVAALKVQLQYTASLAAGRVVV